MSEGRTSHRASRLYRVAAALLGLHVMAYGSLGTLCFVADLYLGDGWWFYWPLLVWAPVLLVHFLYVKSVAADEDWAEQRAEDLKYKAYDMGHIESIQARYEEGPPSARREDRTAD